jgi:hypothetical protein
MLTIVAVLAFLVSFIALRHLQPGGILFYQGCALAVLTATAQVAVARARFRQGWSTTIKDAMTTLLLIYAFVFTVPVTADRSYSVMMLKHIGEAPGGLSRDEVNRRYISEFVDRGGVDKRLVEQQATGTIARQGDAYVLTARGRMLDQAFRWTCRVFACQQQ